MNSTIIGLFKKELAQTFRDKRMWAMLFIMPIIQLTLFGLAISTEVKNIKLGAVYEPNDILAKRMVEHCLASRWFIPAKEIGRANV
jgi:ABC-2 type transport system permease protein